MLRRRWLRRLLQVLAMVVLLVTGVTLWTYRNVRRSVSVQPTRKADVIIVLGAGSHGLEPTRVYRSRLDHALALYQAGWAPRIIVTELAPAAQAAQDYLLKSGVPAEAIAFEDRSTTTLENLRYAQEVMIDNGCESAIVASCPPHLFRALRMCQDLGIPAEGAAAAPCLLERRRVDRLRWTLRECVIYIIYRCRHI